MAVVIEWKPGTDRNSDDPIVHGPFKSGQEASAWAFRNLDAAGTWYWMPLTYPKLA